VLYCEVTVGYNPRFGVGFNAATMADQPYAIIVDGAGEVTERKLGPHRPGSLLKASVTVREQQIGGSGGSLEPPGPLS
jgi:hypothetical protein